MPRSGLPHVYWQVGGSAAALLMTWLGWLSIVHLTVETGSRAQQQIKVRETGPPGKWWLDMASEDRWDGSAEDGGGWTCGQCSY